MKEVRYPQVAIVKEPRLAIIKNMSKTRKRNPTKKESDAFALVGRIGGKAIFKKIGKKGMRELGKLGAKKRWSTEE